VRIRGNLYTRSDIVFDENAFGITASNPPILVLPEQTEPVENETAPQTEGEPTVHTEPVLPDRTDTEQQQVDNDILPDYGHDTAAEPHEQVAAEGQRAVGTKSKQSYIPTAGAQAVKKNKRLASANAKYSMFAVKAHNTDPEFYKDTYDSDPSLPTVVPGQSLPVPKTFEEALTCKYACYWKKAIEDELDSITDMDVYTETALPPKKNALTSRWVFTWKVNDGKVVKAKARLVVRGFEQREGVDYSLLFAPTVSQVTIRTLLATAAAKGWYVHQIDFKTAFLNGELNEEVYMQIPQGSPMRPFGKVWKLNKSLYGLKQAPRCWYRKLEEKLGMIGFKQSSADDALFFRREKDGNMSYVCVHVDDMLIAHCDKAVVLSIVELLSSIFEITDCGRCHTYLGLQIEHLPTGIFIHQSDYALNLVQTHMSFEKVHAITPLPPKTSLVQVKSPFGAGEDRRPFTDHKLYRQVIGELMYLSNFTRPDICHAVNQLSGYNDHPSISHWKAAQHIVGYLHHTHDFGILYKKGEPIVCEGFCDASFCSERDTSRSVTGYCFKMSKGVVAWRSKRQNTVALSTAESEYMAMSEAGRLGVSLNAMLKEMRELEAPVSIFTCENEPMLLDSKAKDADSLRKAQLIHTDSMSALKMVLKDHTTKSMKHVAKYHHWARERVEQGLLSFVHIKGDDNISDTFTKALPVPKFWMCRAGMGMVAYSELKNK
jgi:hypothetical protein